MDTGGVDTRSWCLSASIALILYTQVSMLAMSQILSHFVVHSFHSHMTPRNRSISRISASPRLALVSVQEYVQIHDTKRAPVF